MATYMKTIKLKVKVIGSGTQEDPFRVDLPTYQMIPGTEEYDAADKKVLKKVEVLVPADECDESGQLSAKKIRTKYKGQHRWDHKDILKTV